MLVGAVAMVLVAMVVGGDQRCRSIQGASQWCGYVTKAGRGRDTFGKLAGSVRFAGKVVF